MTNARRGETTKLELEDRGQDFLWFIVDKEKIVDAGPFQGWFWIGQKILPPKKWRKGSRVTFIDGKTLNYPVVRAALSTTGEGE